MNGCLHSDKDWNYNNVTKLLVKPFLRMRGEREAKVRKSQEKKQKSGGK